MENNPKYYIPDIEDIRYGYEYEELFENIPLEEEQLIQEWRHTIFGFSQDINEYNRLRQILAGTHFSFNTYGTLVRKNQIRVPFLTKEQIEAEGWKFEFDTHPGINLTIFHFEKKELDEDYDSEYYLTHHLQLFIANQNPHVFITKEQAPSHHGTVFSGECKSINEFRYIAKLLKI